MVDTVISRGQIVRTPINTTTGQVSPINDLMSTFHGTVTLNGATGVVVANTNVTANSTIIFTLKTIGGTPSPNAPNVTAITAGTGFTVAGTAGDTSVYNYRIFG
jgi:hypothetical protein